MTFAIRMILILTLVVPVTCGVSAQETPAQEAAAPQTATAVEATQTAPETTAVPAEATPAPAETRPSHEIRSEFATLLRRHPPEVSRILALDPALLNNAGYLARYPELEQFIAANPEIRRNPHYFLAEFRRAPAVPREQSGFAEVMETLFIFATFALIAVALAWIIRTIIEQKRWNRLSRTQSEVHNKILDRFSTSDELLAYVNTPAGTKFLESAPIPLHAEKASRSVANPSLARIMWSIHLGVIVAVGALGMMLVSLAFDGETAQGFFAMGVIGFCIGAGFIASAVVSIVLSQRLGVWEGQERTGSAAGTHPLDDTGRVR